MSDGERYVRPRISPPAVNEAVRRSMRANRGKDTGPEIKLRRALWQAGLRGYRNNVRKLPGAPDIVFTSRKTCIFVHGCYWHGCPRCSARRNLEPTAHKEYWVSKIARTHERDARNLAALLESGWTVIVVWECDLARHLGDIVAGIVAQLGSALADD